MLCKSSRTKLKLRLRLKRMLLLKQRPMSAPRRDRLMWTRYRYSPFAALDGACFDGDHVT